MSGGGNIQQLAMMLAQHMQPQQPMAPMPQVPAQPASVQQFIAQSQPGYFGATPNYTMNQGGWFPSPFLAGLTPHIGPQSQVPVIADPSQMAGMQQLSVPAANVPFFGQGIGSAPAPAAAPAPAPAQTQQQSQLADQQRAAAAAGAGSDG